MTLYTFDVDGTLLTERMKGENQYVKGIIPTSKLLELENKGHYIAIVSPSPFLPKEYEDVWFKEYESNDYRWKNIADAMLFYHEIEENTVYIDDLIGNLKSVNKVFPKMKFYTPQEFMVE